MKTEVKVFTLEHPMGVKDLVIFSGIRTLPDCLVILSNDTYVINLQFLASCDMNYKCTHL